MGRGVKRKIDPLGRCVIPREFRKLFDIKSGDYVEVACHEDSLTLTPCHFITCASCGKNYDETYTYCPYCGEKQHC